MDVVIKLSSEMKLINEKIAKQNPSQLFEQYKLFVESAEKVSQRRDNANHFYLGLNALILSISSYLGAAQQNNLMYVVIPIAAILINLHWHNIIISFKNLNTGKFQVIHELEALLPANLYKYEWEIIGKGETKKYKPVTHIEKSIPIIFIGLYIVLLVLLICANWFF